MNIQKNLEWASKQSPVHDVFQEQVRSCWMTCSVQEQSPPYLIVHIVA